MDVHAASVYDPDLLAMREMETVLRATAGVLSTSFELSGQSVNRNYVFQKKE